MLASLTLLVALAQAPAAPPGAQAPAFTAEATPEGLRLVATVDGLPQELARVKVGAVKDLLRRGTTLYATLAAGGVVAIDARVPSAPVVTAHFADGQIVDQLAHQGPDVLVLMLASHESLAFGLVDPLHPLPAGPAAAPSVDLFRGRGRVLGVKDGTVVIEGGTAAGFHVGEHVRIRRPGKLSAADAVAKAAGMSAEGSVSAVVSLERVEGDRSVAQLGRGDSAEVGDVIEATGEPTTASIVAPGAVPFSWRLQFALRPFVNLNSSSNAVGLLTDAMVSYYFAEAPVRVEAGIQPLGLAAGGGSQHNPLIAVADVAYTDTYFELGIGTGFALLQPVPGVCFATGGFTNNNACNQSNGSTEADPLVVETLRLGALDGLNVSGMAAIGSSSGTFSSSGSAGGFVVRSVRAELNLPVATHFSLYLAGGGASNTYAYGELGARTYLNGVGGPGTLIVSGGLGGAGLSDGSQSLSGLSLALGFELRL